MDNEELTELLKELVNAAVSMAENVEVIATAFQRLAAHELGEAEE